MAENNDNSVGVSYIEMEREKIDPDEVAEVEHLCNEAIRKGIRQ
jgi:hypothetical protein